MKKSGITGYLHFFAQTTKDFYNQVMEKAYAGELEEAIRLPDKSIELKKDEYIACYKRGMVQARLKREKEANYDFNETIQLYSEHKNVF